MSNRKAEVYLDKAPIELDTWNPAVWESPKRVIILCGVSGVGKTHARLHDPELVDLPYVDIADVYRDLPYASARVATEALINKVLKLLKEHDSVVVEGYFLPDTPSRSLLITRLDRFAQVLFRLMVEEIEVCRLRVIGSGEDVDLRLEILNKVWAKSGPILMRMKRECKAWSYEQGEIV